MYSAAALDFAAFKITDTGIMSDTAPLITFGTFGTRILSVYFSYACSMHYADAMLFLAS